MTTPRPAATRSRRSTRSRAAALPPRSPAPSAREGVVVGDFEGTAAVQRLLHPGSDRRRQRGDLGRHLRLHGQRQHRERRRPRARHRLRPRALRPRRRSTAANSDTAPVPAANILTCGTGNVVAPTDVSLPFATATTPEQYEGHARPPAAVARDLRVLQLRPVRRDRSRTAARRRVTAVLGHGGRRTRARRRTHERWRTASAGSRSTTTRAPRIRPCCGTRTASRSRSATGSGAATSCTNTVGVLGFDFSLYRIYPTAGGGLHACQPAPGCPGTGGRHAPGRGDEHAQLLRHAGHHHERHRPRAVRRQREPRLPRSRRRPAARVPPPARRSSSPRCPGSTETSSVSTSSRTRPASSRSRASSTACPGTTTSTPGRSEPTRSRSASSTARRS